MGVSLPVRLALLAVWAVLAGLVAGILAAWGDAAGLALAAAWLILAVVEGYGIVSQAGGDTISERLSWWVRGHPWRTALFLGLLVVFAVHILVAWP